MKTEVMNGELKLYEFKNAQWSRMTDSGSRHVLDKAPPGVSNAEKGDWLVKRTRGTDVSIKRRSTDRMAVYYKHGDWHLLRGKAHHSDSLAEHRKFTRELLSAISGYPNGTIAVDQTSNGDVKVNVYKLDGQTETWKTEVRVEVDANKEPVFNAEPQGRSREDELMEQVAREADLYANKLKSQDAKRIINEYIGWEHDDSKATALRKELGAILAEAVPSPATSGVTGANDLAQLALNIYTEARNYPQGQGEYELPTSVSGLSAGSGLVHNGIAGLGSIIDYVIQVRAIHTAENTAPGTTTGRAQFDGQLNQAAASGILSASKSISKALELTNTVSSLASSNLASQLASATEKAAGPVGTLISFVSATRHSRKAHRARIRRRKIEQHMISASGQEVDVQLQRCISFLFHKMGRRFKTQVGNATVASVSFVAGASGAIAAAVSVGAATAWSPVGWALLGGAAVGGMGLLGYKVYRRWTRKSRHANRASKGNNAGVVDAQSAARKLIQISCSDKLPPHQIEIANAVLSEFNVDASELKDPGAREAAVAMIVRHTEV